MRVFREICGTPVEPDGLRFDASTVRGETIREGATYGGVRLKLLATLERARIPLQVDVGFGDAITPMAEVVRFPVLLGGPAPTLRGYPLATVVAEKLESLTRLGLATSRMKDLYDLWHVLRAFDLDGDEVRTAIARTFDRRGTAVVAEPTVLTRAFWADPSKRTQWSAFLRRSELNAPGLEEVARDIALRLRPMMPR